ncbi:sensor histidine kinase [Aeromicrobium sp. CF4.19]|uniref:sensor histidine kinase n=1 Tax=Aeromicrobium sp. CF4.19 TaxID=3373082 RepID=UPI003EE586F2
MSERTTQVSPLAALALFVLAGALQSGQATGTVLVTAGVVLAAGVAIVCAAPSGWPLLGLLGLATAAQFVLCHGTPANVGWFGICVIAGWAAFELPARWAIAACAVLVAGFALEWAALPDEPGWGAWTAGTIFTTAACTIARRQRELVHQLREAQAALTDQARAEERQRIAAEMHDVIGHALTVSLLHVSSARLALEDDPDLARSSLVEAERLAGASLQEVRAAVGLVRGEGSAGVTPLPSGSELDELVTSYRRAGRAVELEVRGDAGALGATRGLAVHRIVQESLTNAVRHGDASGVRVLVDVGATETIVRVHNAGTSLAGSVEGSGVIGMRERAEALGGSLEAGPSSDGWTVEARLPA